MEKTVAYLAHHPVLFIIAVIVALLILFSFLKKVVQVFLVVTAFLVLYAAYLYVSGGHIHEIFQYIEHAVKNMFHFLSDMFSFFKNLLKVPKFPKQEML